VLQTIHQAKANAVTCGSVGIGRGLCALGAKGGVGAASQMVSLGEKEYILGALIAANGGLPFGNPDAHQPVSITPSFVLILATNLPLFPEQLRQLAEAGIRSYDGIIRFDDGTQQLALAFSTSNTIDNAFSERFQLFSMQLPGEEQMAGIFYAAGICCREALRLALENSEIVVGRKNRHAVPLARNELARLFSQ
jgi:D-aminopeptidase